MPRRIPARLALSLAALAAGPAMAYWEVIPQVDAGITFETNPRYLSDQEVDALEPLIPDVGDDVFGTFVDARLTGSYETPSNKLSLVPRIRKTDYLKSNQDLNDDDWYVDLFATHSGLLGNADLQAQYQETGVRTSEFESATPEDPDAPPPVTGASGRFSQETQSRWNVRPSLQYQLSPRNIVGINAEFTETTYEEDAAELLARNNYLDYGYSSGELFVQHVLNDRNYVAIGLTRGTFLAEESGSPFRNSTDSFGINTTYSRAFSDTLSGTITAGVTRSSVDVRGIVGAPGFPVFDPVTNAECRVSAPCSVSNEERNFTGSISLRKRSELTTMNLSLASQIVPRSDGTEVVQEQARFYLSRTLTRRLSGTVSALYSMESAVGRVFESETATIGFARQDRNYFTVDTRLSWRLTPTLSTYGTYSYTNNEYDVTTGNVDEDNHRLFFGVSYRGVGFRR